MPILAAGSRARVGFSAATMHDRSFIENTVFPDMEGCLYNTGQFQGLEFIYKEGGLFQNDYLLIIGTTAADFADTEDFGGLIAQTLEYCAPDVAQVVDHRDPVVVDAVPQSAVGQVGVQQVNATDSGVKPKGECDDRKGLDYLACQSGLSKDSIKVGIPVVGIGLLIGLALILRR